MNDNEMNNDNLQDPEIKENDSTDYRKSESLSLPVLAAVIAAIAGISILLVPGKTKKSQHIQETNAEDSVSEEQTLSTASNTPTPLPTVFPYVHEQNEKKIIRDTNNYLVYPESYEISLKSFPEDFSDRNKELLIDAIGSYAYEEGFTVESAEYANDLMSNTADGIRVFGMTLNGMDDFFVTTVWIPDADNAGEYLFVMDRRTLEDVRQESPAEEVVNSPNRQESETIGPASTATPSPTPTPRPTSTPIPTATPIPFPTSDYQPDQLEIRGVPGEIVDSFESVEEFRNSIYNFMYDHDIRVTVISADAYYEQYGENIYDFTLSASNRTIYARYDADVNEYYYSFEKFS